MPPKELLNLVYYSSRLAMRGGEGPSCYPALIYC